MQVHQVQPSALQFVFMLVVFGIVIALRSRSLMRVRPLKIEQLWIVPALYAAVVAYLFVKSPPRARDPRWGIRSLEAVCEAATCFTPGATMAMPANNLTLVFRRR